MRGNHTLMFPSLSPSLPLALKINKLKKKKEKKNTGWDKSRFAVVCMENNRINNSTSMNCFVHSLL